MSKSNKVEVGSESIYINGEEFVKKSSVVSDKAAVSTEGLPCVLVRTYSAGVFVGYLKSRTGREVELVKARRIWYWEGAASLSQLAQSGTTKPGSCKFPEEVNKVLLLEAVEILDVTEKAKSTIDSVKVWKA